MNHAHLLHPSLFDSAVYEALESELGLARYARALEEGASFTLDTCIDDLESRLDNFEHSSLQT